MKFTIRDYQDYKMATSKEWLLTNGLGGYSSSTIVGSNTRRYHGLLNVSKNPPVDRHLVFSKIDEVLDINNEQIGLMSHRAYGHTKDGFQYLYEVVVEDTITYRYMVGNILIEKEIVLAKGKNSISVNYKVSNMEPFPFTIKLYPLLNERYFHYTNSKQDINVRKFELEDEELRLNINSDDDILMIFKDGVFNEPEEHYFYGMEYDVEKRRGLDYVEDHYIPGYITYEIKENSKKSFSIEVKVLGYDYDKVNLNSLDNSDDKVLKLLTKAASDFVVYRKSVDSKTILAGYPWFNDWGRDAMIALPGLLLSTKKYSDAKEVLSTFAKYEKDGIIPNMLPDGNGEPLYNTVDASLWFIHASYKYYLATNDDSFYRDTLLPVMINIVNSYRAGTHYGIMMDSDGLLCAGDETTQLTWMDAKVGDFVVTPRHGKAIEINALWYFALSVLYKATLDKTYESLRQMVYDSFNLKFVDEEKGMIYDVIDSGFDKSKSDKFRPNCLYSIGLDFPVLDPKYWNVVMEVAVSELYTPYGIASLSKRDIDYRGYYEGDQFSRDTAYHQGIGWGFLIGIFIDAYIKTYHDVEKARIMISPLIGHLKDACIGQVSEIFESYYPYEPRGCFAQAWSVGELLRTYIKLKED